MHRALAPLLLLLVIAACARRGPLPPPQMAHDDEALGYESDGLASHDPARRSVRQVQDRCMDTVAALGRDVNDEETAELALTALAVAAYVIGQSTGASTVSPGLPDCPPNQDPAGLETRCRLTTLVPSTGNGEGGPIDQRVDAVHSDAYDRIVAINQASNALDEFVTLHPRSADWDDAEYAEFTGLRDALAATCER